MTVRKLYQAAAARLGECSEAVEEGVGLLCQRHWLVWAERHPRRPLWTLEPPGEETAA